MEGGNISFNSVQNISYLYSTKGDELHWEEDPRFLATFYTMYLTEGTFESATGIGCVYELSFFLSSYLW